MDFYGMDVMDMQDDWDESGMEPSWMSQEKEGGSRKKPSNSQYNESSWSSKKSSKRR
jgi:hypothetical protein